MAENFQLPWGEAESEVVDVPLGDVASDTTRPDIAPTAHTDPDTSGSRGFDDGDDFSPPQMQIPFTDETATVDFTTVIGCLRDRSKDVVLSGWFTIFYAVLILMNMMIVILVLCEQHRSVGFVLLDLVVNCTFVIDLALRIFALGKAFFWIGASRALCARYVACAAYARTIVSSLSVPSASHDISHSSLLLYAPLPPPLSASADIPGEGVAKLLRQPWFNWFDLALVTVCVVTFFVYINRLNDAAEGVVEAIVIVGRSAVVVVRVVVRIVLQCRRARSIKAEEYVNFDVLDGAQNDFDDDKSGISHFGLV